MYDPFAPVPPPGTIQTMGQPMTNPGAPVAPVPNALGGLGDGKMHGGINRFLRRLPDNWAEIAQQRYGTQPGFAPWLTGMQSWLGARPEQGTDMSHHDWRGAQRDWRGDMPALPGWLPQTARGWRGFGG